MVKRDIKSAAQDLDSVMKPAPRRLAIASFVAAFAVAVAPVAAQAADTTSTESARAKDRLAAGWTRTLSVQLSPRRLHLQADASPRRLARAALRRHARRLGLPRSLDGVRLARELRLAGGPGGARDLHSLRFRQTVGGVRVVWSKIDVAVSPRGVSSIIATVVPVRVDPVQVRRRIGRARALAVARRRVAGRERALRPQLVVYAGKPTTAKVSRRRPRLAYLVEASPVSELREHSPIPLCVVIDAHTGKVLAEWKGHAARPVQTQAGSRRVSTASRARTTAVSRLIMAVVDAQDQRFHTLGALYSTWSTTGDPFERADWPELPTFHQTWRNPVVDAASEKALRVLTHMCFTRDFCGRDGHLPQWQAFLFAANVRDGSSRYIPAEERVYVDERAGGADDLIAHEFGHHVDFTYADERIVDNREVQEVQEGLANMFAYDYDREDYSIGEDTGTRISLSMPGSVQGPVDGVYPALMRSYKCDATDVHHNATILSHAYWRFVQKVGHDKAGHVLQYIPWALPARPTFVALKNSFIQRAQELYGGGVAADATEAFVDEVGIGRDVPSCSRERLGGGPGPVVPPTELPTLQ